VHDYHLIPLAALLRARGVRNRIGFFLHTPLPAAALLIALPRHRELLETLASYDLVGVQTARHAESHKEIGQLRNSLEGRSLIIGVDRLDYSKGIPARLEAYERFLAAHPEWHGKITYLQITPKSRSQIKEYSEMVESVNAMAGRINGAYSNASWSPMRYVNRPYSRTALAGFYRTAKVGLVTPMRDGMNLVAKEFVAAQDEDDPGVLVLSRFAGAAAEFGAALVVNPYDPDAVGAAIARAVAMPLDERRSRHKDLYAALLRNDISDWGDKFLRSLAAGSDKPRAVDAIRDLVSPGIA
jgi:trehalose 6-phosphate synthase